MGKIVLTFGLIGGAILSAMMMLSLLYKDAIGFDRAAVVGYTSMVLAFLLIYFGVRSYRDNVAGGRVRFLRALGVGLLIALVASVCYVATWQVIYFRLQPDFLNKYQDYLTEKARAKGESEEAIARQKSEFESFKKMYDNPAFNAAVTFLEPMPVAVIMALVSAGVLSRRKAPAGAAS